MRLPALIAAVLLTLPAAAQDFSEEEIKQLALQAILENPEIVMEAVSILQAREAAEAEAAARATLSENRNLLEQDPNAPVFGNPNGDVTVVEFFDYNCPYCRRVGPEIDALIAADANVRVVYREFPILGDGSVFAARAALAAREQGLYPEMHEALMAARGRVDERAVMMVAAEVGLDVDQLRADMEAPEVQAHIETTMQLAQELGFNGTPAFVVGDALAPGLLTTDQLQEMVAAAREEG
ncbi:MAG: DsbA family protein [Pseudomonadota bacterium]